MFELLGRTSGRAVDKLAELALRGVALDTRAGLPLLADCFGYMELRVRAKEQKRSWGAAQLGRLL